MNRYWMLVLVMLIAAAGCDNKEKDAAAAKNAAQDAKVKAAIEKSKGQPKPNIGPPGVGAAKPADDHADKDDHGDENNDDDEGDDEGDVDDEAEAAAEEKAKADEKKDTSAQLDAHDVLDDAIAAAKADDKALLVHFTASW